MDGRESPPKHDDPSSDAVKQKAIGWIKTIGVTKYELASQISTYDEALRRDRLNASLRYAQRKLATLQERHPWLLEDHDCLEAQRMVWLEESRLGNGPKMMINDAPSRVGSVLSEEMYWA